MLFRSAGLMAYYKFNQGFADTDNTTIASVTDATSNGNNATWNSFAANGATSNFVATGGVTPGTACAPFAFVEINVQGNGVDILGGSTTISTTNATDFGSLNINGTAAKNYTIQNTGTGNLTISSITSSNTDFAISEIGRAHV